MRDRASVMAKGRRQTVSRCTERGTARNPLAQLAAPALEHAQRCAADLDGAIPGREAALTPARGARR
eukprot:8138428-Pyramimonas_sp.AAC.1